MSKKILVVDDEAPIRELVEFNLKKEGYEVITAEDGHKALELFYENAVDLVILDLMLPEIDGLEVCKRMRQRSDIPIIMLTAKDSELDKVLGLELGADDYVTKPFSPRELTARIKAVMRRIEKDVAPPEPSKKSSGDDFLVVDEERHEVYINNEKISLTPKEFELLALLAKNPGKVFTRDFLLDKIWGYDYVGDTRTVDVHIRRLRKKIDDDSYEHKHILTVHGLGYKFNSKG